MEKISVAIRVRPLSKHEDAGPWKLGARSISFSNASSVSTQAFTFDQVFGPDIPTCQIYQQSAKDVIASAVQGFNGTIFAYGQTSSGKTYTMRGSPQEPGIIPLALADVFLLIDQASDREFLIRVSYMEIYNEEINDLLAPESLKLQVHENLERGIFVAGLREEIVSSPEQVLELLTYGEAHRRVGETNMNVYSSRSHTIFRMVIESRDMQDSTSSEACDAVRVSVLNLVDLAGSERVAKTGAEGARLKEGTHINRSLMTLGNVINKLSEGIHRHGGHVPYRDSKLTRILQPALGGNAKTTIICNITPALIHADESKGTLQFASRANRVTNCAQVNEVMTDAALLKRQKKEIEDLRTKLQESNSDHLEEEILSLRNNLLKFELERERLALELVENERRLKEQEQKIEKLGTMVINSAIDDRAYAKKGNRRERRETWCPRIPSSNSSTKTPEFKQPFQRASNTDLHSSKRMPPPFEMLLEHDEECSVWSSQEMEKDLDHEEGGLSSISDKTGHVLHRERSLPTSQDEAEPKLASFDLSLQELQDEHEKKMNDLILEMIDVKNELADARAQLSMSVVVVDKQPPALLQCQMCKSLDRGAVDESKSIISNLQNQVHALQSEKFLMQQELDRLMEQSKLRTTSNPHGCKELDRVKTKFTAAVECVENIELCVVERHDVECQTTASTDEDDGDKIFCHRCVGSDSSLPCKEVISEPVTTLHEDLARQETEKAELSSKLAKAEQDTRHLELENLRLTQKLSLRPSGFEETETSGATGDKTLCTDVGHVTDFVMHSASRSTPSSGLEEGMQNEMSSGLDDSAQSAEKTGSKLPAIEVKSAASGVAHLREAAEDTMPLRENVIPFNPETVRKLESMIMKLACGGSNDENVNGVTLKIREILEFVLLHAGGLVQWILSEYEAEKLSFYEELQILTCRICLGAKEGEPSSEGKGISSSDEQIQGCKPELCTVEASMKTGTRHIPQPNVDPACKQAGKQTSLETLRAQVNICLEKVRELQLPHAELQDANNQRLQAQQQVESLKHRISILENELESRLSSVQHMESELQELPTQATRELLVQEKSSPEQEVICQQENSANAKILPCEVESMSSRSYTDSSPGKTPIGQLDTPCSQHNQVSDLDVLHENLDLAVEPEALRQYNQTLISQLEDVTNQLELTKVELSTYNIKLKEIELILSDKDEQCTVLYGRVRDLDQQKAHCESESSQLRSDLLALRKELASLRTAPALVEKERDALRKELDMHKAKLKEIQAKLKSTLQDKSKLEADKANIERELKHLRGSTLLQRDINRRESLAEKKRESMAPALSKTKQQLSSLEQALQMRTTELEKASFDIEVLQKLCSKLEFSVLEAENLGTTLKDQLTSAEAALGTLKEENKLKDDSTARLEIELEETSEQLERSVMEKARLQQESDTLAARLEEHESSSKAKVVELMKENEDLVQQLTDAYTEFEVEKSAWAGRMKDHCDKLVSDANDRVAKLEVHEAASQLRIIELIDENKALVQQLTETYTNFEVEKAALTERLQTQCVDAHKKLELMHSQLSDMKARCTIFEEETAQVREELTAEREARLVQSNQMRQMASAFQECLEIITGLERKCAEISIAFSEKIDVITEAHDARIEFFSEKLMESEQVVGQLAKSMENSFLLVDELQSKAGKEECTLPVKHVKEEATMEVTEWAQTAASSVLSNSKTNLCPRVDLEAENTILKEKNMRLSTLNMKLQVGLQCTKEREEVYRGRLKEVLWETDKLNKSEQVHRRHTGNSEIGEEAKTLDCRKLQKEVAASRLEIEDLAAELAKARAHCSELMQDTRQDRILEMQSENCNLKHRVKIAEEKAKFRRDIIRKLRDEAKIRETSSEEVALKELVVQKGKLEEQVWQLTAELEFLSNQVKSTNFKSPGISVPVVESELLRTCDSRRASPRNARMRRADSTISNTSSSVIGRVPLGPIDRNVAHNELRARGLIPIQNLNVKVSESK